MELLGCMRVIQTVREINRPSHLPWQLAQLGRCVLAVDKSGESPGLTEHTPCQVANNVSGKSKLSHKGTHRAIFRIPFFLFFILTPLYFNIYSSAFQSLYPFLPCFLFFSPHG